MNLIVASIPIFFILIGIEILAAKVLDRPVYSFSDSFADLGCGIIEQLLGVFVKGALFAGYLWLYASARVATLPATSWAVWVLCFVLVDFFYYWFHRKSHEIGAFWAAHSVHHQSEEYNLTVALRQGAFQSFFSWVFYLPLAILGFPPQVFLTCAAINTLYQFWIHTRLVGKLGPLEWVMNTPSHHRVHHGRNPEYIDRNHAGVFIVWDRMFGTFVEEKDEPVYGVVKPLRSFDPVFANVAGWIDLARIAKAASRFVDGLRVFVERPGWRPAELGGPVVPPPVDRATTKPFDVPRNPLRTAYVAAQFLLVLAGSSVLLGRASTLPAATVLALAGFFVFSLAVLAKLLTRPSNLALGLETVRLAFLAAIAVGLARQLGQIV